MKTPLNEKVKVLFFANTTLIGGAERNFLDIAKHLNPRLFSPWICGLEPGGPLEDLSKKTKISYFQPKFKGYFNLSTWFSVLTFLRKEKFDIVLLSGLKLRLFLLPLCLFLRIPVRIGNVVGLDVWKKWYHHLAERVLNPLTTAWVANSLSARDRAISLEGKPQFKFQTIYQGLDFDPGAIPKFFDGQGSFKIVVLANIREGKGHDFLLRTLAENPEIFDDVQVEFVGQDESDGRTQQLISTLGLSEKVKLCGFVENPREYLNQFNLMVLPSFAESFPTSLLEGMIEGIPIIATRVGGVPELIEHGLNGLLIEPGNRRELAEAILTLKNDPQLRKAIAQAGFQVVRDKFHIHQVAFRYERFFRCLLPSNHPLAFKKIMRIQSRIVVGGPSLHTINLAAEFSNQNYDTFLVGGDGDSNEKSMVSFAVAKDINVFLIREMGRDIDLFADLKSLWTLWRFIGFYRPDIIHTHTAKAGALGRIAGIARRVPSLYHTFHGHVFEHYFSPLKSRTFIWVEKILAIFCKSVIVISEQQKVDILEKFKITSADKVKLIPLGFDWNVFQKEPFSVPFQKTSNYESKIKIAIIGRVVPVKDHRLFVEIAAILERKYPERFCFLIVGRGEMESEIKETVDRMGLGSAFIFTGWLELNKLVYQNFNLVLLTSKNEGTPVTIIEALAAGVPVVASDVGGVRDVLRLWTDEFVVASRNPNEFVKKIEKIVFSQTIVPENISNKILEKYSLNRLVKDLNNLYSN
ncbi:MAG: glycosyltransferase [Bacteroidetes bacterium]|nr:glycosyltransferase [Bacteroidota bacterium]